jgi:hypothetical protein
VEPPRSLRQRHAPLDRGASLDTTPRHLAPTLVGVIALLAAGLLATGCGSGVQARSAADVTIALKTDPSPECRYVSPIVGRDTDRTTPFAMNYAGAEADLRLTAVRAGGNHVVVDVVRPPNVETDLVPEFLIQGRLFSCPRGGGPPPSSAATTAPPPKACEPECSPGFTCLRGTCVSACNPACDSSQRCGMDRLCHPAGP